jgi:hypothetical protein
MGKYIGLGLKNGRRGLASSATGSRSGGDKLLNMTSCHGYRDNIRQCRCPDPADREGAWMAVSEEARWDDCIHED